MERKQDGMKIRRRILIALVALLLVVAAVTGWYIWQSTQGPKEFIFDSAAVEGRIRTMSDDEIREEMNRVVREGMFNISIAANVVFPTPDGDGDARIENIAANRYHMQVDIALDETGETVYSSQGIKPGMSIEKIKLNKLLPAGVYDATATFTAITQDTFEIYGRTAAKILLTIFDPDGLVTPSPTPEPTPVPEPAPSPKAAPQSANGTAKALSRTSAVPREAYAYFID